MSVEAPERSQSRPTQAVDLPRTEVEAHPELSVPTANYFKREIVPLEISPIAKAFARSGNDSGPVLVTPRYPLGKEKPEPVREGENSHYGVGLTKLIEIPKPGEWDQKAEPLVPGSDWYVLKQLQPNILMVESLPPDPNKSAYPEYEAINSTYGDRFIPKKDGTGKSGENSQEPNPPLIAENSPSIADDADVRVDRLIDPNDPTTFGYVVVNRKNLEYRNETKASIDIQREMHNKYNVDVSMSRNGHANGHEIRAGQEIDIDKVREQIIVQFVNKIEEEMPEEPIKVRRDWEEIIATVAEDIRNTINLNHCAEEANKRHINWKNAAQSVSEDDPVWQTSNWKANKLSNVEKVLKEAAGL